MMLSLPRDIIENEVLTYLDEYSLARVNMVAKQLNQHSSAAFLWQRLTTHTFGVQSDCTVLSWRQIFSWAMQAIVCSRSFDQVEEGKDVLKMYEEFQQRHSRSKDVFIREEIILLNGLKKFPSDATLYRTYANFIRDQMPLQQQLKI